MDDDDQLYAEGPARRDPGGAGPASHGPSSRLSPGWVVLGILALFLGIVLGLVMSLVGTPT